MLHSALITNVHLFKWNIKKNDLCTFCQTHKETIAHLFYTCVHTQQIWKSLITYMHKMEQSTLLELSQDVIPTNYFIDDPRHAFNFIVLLSKQYIYASRCLKNIPNFNHLVQQIERVKSFELFQVKKTNMIKKHCIKWNLKDYNGTGLDKEVINQILTV